MRHSKTKKSILAVGTALIPASTTLLASGEYVEGGLLMIVTAMLFVSYDYLDDRAKGVPELPAGIDAEMIESVVEQIADDINNRRDDD